MKAVILVGGEATRLLPLTCNIPKAMIPVLNTPFLEHVVRRLSDYQIKDIILTQSRMSQPIESYFDDGSQFGVRLSYSIENAPLGTAGAVKNAEPYLDDTFLVLNGDIFTDLDIAAMINYHRERKAKVTIALTPVEDPTSYGLIETNNLGRVTRFLEKPKPSQVTTNMINAGIYVLELDVLNQVPSQVKFSFERELFPLLLDRGESIYAYPFSTYWIDIGTPEKYLQLTGDLLHGMSSQYTPGPKEVVIGDQSHIHPTAQIKGAVVIGANCTIERKVKLVGPLVIGSGCQILSQAVVEDSIIWHNVQIGNGVIIKGSIVADNCCLNADSIIEDSVLSDNVTVVRDYKLEPGSKIWPGKTVGILK